MSLLDHTLLELRDGIRAGSFSAAEVASAYLAAIEAHNADIGAYLAVDAEGAQRAAEAAAADKDTLLAGVPLGMKDIFVTEGVVTTAGSRLLEGWTPPYDATVVARLRQHGAVILGKVSMDEFAMGSSNENTPFAKVRNPWHPNYVPGGSSGGSAAAVAGRLAPATLGTDTGGSIRQPGALTNIVGLKPTYGRVSRFGMVAFSSSLDQAGPMTRTIEDAALVLQAIAGHDANDATTVKQPVEDWLGACKDASLAGKRVGIHRAALELEGLDPQVRAAFDASLEVLKDAGAELCEVDLPNFGHAVATYYVLTAAEAASNLARYDGIRYGNRVAGDDLLDTYRNTREEGFGAEVKRRILLGTFVLRKDSYDAYYGRAQRVRTLIARDYEAAFKQCDLIVSPTTPTPGFKHGDRTENPLEMYLSDIFTIGGNLAGLPGVSIPGGFSEATDDRPRLPIGLQLMAPPWQESRLFAAGAAYQSRTAWHREVAPGAAR